MIELFLTLLVVVFLFAALYWAVGLLIASLLHFISFILPRKKHDE